jgi:hypothetical protein
MTYLMLENWFAIDFDRVPKKELREYFDQFLKIIPQRIVELAATVGQTPAIEQWKPNYSPVSVELLGEWFATQVETRPRPPDEIKRIQAGSPYPIDVPGNALTKRTLSLAVDVGIYFGESLVHNYPSLKWELPLGSKRFIHYGKPVLSGFANSVTLNPTRVVTVFALGVADGSRTGSRMKELYDIWSQQITKNRS